ncbi:MAG: hypothetical protein KC478_15460, partial [Bacteriovoracaceae bacterium]|nr:hypothetical protein [Bacteriovoracaceae bacterium]
EQMSKAVESNTSEIKKIVKAIKSSRQQSNEDCKKVDTIGESDRYPLAQGSPPSVKVDGAALLLKKLDVL